MADPTITLLEYLRKVIVDLHSDFPSQGTQLLAQLAIEFEAEQQSGAGRDERSPVRTAYPGGRRERVWETQVGEIPLRIPKLREGSLFLSLLEPRTRAEKALLAVVQAAYVQGVSTGKVDDLVRALGLTGIDNSKVRQDHRLVSQALVVAIAVRETGDREILGLALGSSEECAFWLDFLRSLVRRGW